MVAVVIGRLIAILPPLTLEHWVAEEHLCSQLGLG